MGRDRMLKTTALFIIPLSFCLASSLVPDTGNYREIFSNRCPGRLLETSIYQKPYLIDLVPGEQGFQQSQVCFLTFTADPKWNDNGDRIRLCFKVLKFVFYNCSIAIKVWDSQESVTYYEPHPSGMTQRCFGETAAYLTVRSWDYTHCGPATGVVIEVTAWDANREKEKQRGKTILIATVSVALSFGACSLAYYKCVYKPRLARQRQTRNGRREPDHDSNMTFFLDPYSSDPRYSPTHRPISLPTVNRSHPTPWQGHHSSHGSLAYPAPWRGFHYSSHGSLGQAADDDSRLGASCSTSLIDVHNDDQTARGPQVTNTQAPPPSYEECMAAMPDLDQVPDSPPEEETNIDDVTWRREEDSPPPYPGL